MRNLAVALTLLTASACAPDEEAAERHDPQNIDPVEFCSKLPAEEALAIQEHVSDRADAALAEMAVGLGTADSETVDQVRTALIAEMLAWGYSVSTEPVDPAAAHRTEDTSCKLGPDESYKYCEDTLFQPHRPSYYGWQWEKSSETRGGTHFTSLFEVVGTTWEPHFTEPLQVEIATQCGKITSSGTIRDYQPQQDGNNITYVAVDIPVEETQTFCTAEALVGGKPLYPPHAATVVGVTVIEDGKLSDEWVERPFNGTDAYDQPFLNDRVKVHYSFQNSGLPLAYASRVVNGWDLEDASSCDAEPHQSFISRVTTVLKSFFKL